MSVHLCWRHSHNGLSVVADGPDGLCRGCRDRDIAPPQSSWLPEPAVPEPVFPAPELDGSRCGVCGYLKGSAGCRMQCSKVTVVRRRDRGGQPATLAPPNATIALAGDLQ